MTGFLVQAPDAVTRLVCALDMPLNRFASVWHVLEILANRSGGILPPWETLPQIVGDILGCRRGVPAYITQIIHKLHDCSMILIDQGECLLAGWLVALKKHPSRRVITCRDLYRRLRRLWEGRSLETDDSTRRHAFEGRRHRCYQMVKALMHINAPLDDSEQARLQLSEHLGLKRSLHRFSKIFQAALEWYRQLRLGRSDWGFLAGYLGKSIGWLNDKGRALLALLPPQQTPNNEREIMPMTEQITEEIAEKIVARPIEKTGDDLFDYILSTAPNGESVQRLFRRYESAYAALLQGLLTKPFRRHVWALHAVFEDMRMHKDGEGCRRVSHILKLLSRFELTYGAWLESVEEKREMME